MEKKIKIGILGCAKIAEKYAIKALQAIKNVKVVSIASRDPAKAKEWAGRFGIRSIDSYGSLILNREINAVYVPLPIGLHEEWILKAAAAKKHVISEKSLADNFASAKKIVTACQKNNVVLYENFMCDFHPQHQAVLDLIKKGEIGKPFIFYSSFGIPPRDKHDIRYDKKLGGGALNDIGAYTIFMARKILRNEPLTVNATLYRNKVGGVDLKGAILLKFPNEILAMLAFSFDAIYQNNYSVWGNKGLIKTEMAYSIPPDLKPTVRLITNENLKRTISDIELDIPAANHFEIIFQDFCDTVLNQQQRTGKINWIYSNLLNQAKVMEAIRISSKENRIVNLSEIN